MVSASSRFSLEQRVQLCVRFAGGRSFRPSGQPWGEELTKVASVFVNDPVGLCLAALIVVRGIVKGAVQTCVKRPVAGGTMLSEANPLPRLNLASAFPAVHVPGLARLKVIVPFIADHAFADDH
jgi:hypothetical protein